MRAWRYISLAFLIALGCGAGARAQESAESQYPVISAYIYNFTQFTTWPADAVKDQFTVCVLGHNPFGPSLAPLRTRTVNGKGISEKFYKGASADISDCNALFVSESERDNVDEILKLVRGKPVLTMSNMDGFVDSGGMVEFTKKDSRIGIRIGLHSVEASGISISSKLLRLAETSE
ncbi:MAG TPA: YfiR family protein [Patescibacteria group bacterium]|nr:YfiR family protein [Patescibacteria group bacterium]